MKQKTSIPPRTPSGLPWGLLPAAFLVLSFPHLPTRAPAAEAPSPHLARLGSTPDWTRLDPYQGTMTRAEFVHLLQHCYSRRPGDSGATIRIEEDRALILKQSNTPEAGWYDLRFRVAPLLPEAAPRYWRAPLDLDDLPANSSQPLSGLRVAIDPGHIGGKWVTWDDRHFRLGDRDSLEVKEGEMTLIVAKLLKRDLTLLGAEVHLTRDSNNPVTKERVETLQEEAKAYLIQRGQIPSAGRVAATAKAMFAISSEIRARGDLINDSIRPDVALCLHFDASPWPGGRPAFRSPNHLHLLINGCYSDSEFLAAYEEGRDQSRYAEKDETRLPAFAYDGNSGKSVSNNELVWARNLLANRVFLCPVLFFEPFCMNHRETHARVQEGLYDGLREINGVYRKNLYQEYADGVTAGLVRYYRKHRQRLAPGQRAIAE